MKDKSFIMDSIISRKFNFAEENVSKISPFEIFEMGYNEINIPTDKLTDVLYVQYMQGLFKKNGKITKYLCSVKSKNREILQKLAKVIGIPFEDYGESCECSESGECAECNYIIFYTKNHAMDFLDKIFPGITFYSHFKTNPLLNMGDPVPICNVAKTMPNAVIPFKTRTSDVGYDLTIIDIKKKISDKCTLYTTGIIVEIESDWYTEIVPRSSLIKTGYIMANSVGIIESTYKGELMIALTKVDENAPDIELPYRGFQLIIRRQYHARMMEIDIDKLQSSKRGDGGFGSTN